ncbi:MAG: amidohydrolase family protein [Pseudolabrys sp.]
MTIDVHAHYIPQSLIATARERGTQIGVRVIDSASTAPALEFSYGFKVRPFFPKLIETASTRIAWLDSQRLDRQFVATWPDIFGYGLPRDQCAAWHRMLNDTLAGWCADNAARISFVASVPLPNAEDAAAELERAAGVGAVAVMTSANIEGKNIGELPLDQLWARATQLRMPVMIHPMAAALFPRAAKFGLTQSVQYTFDTTLGVGSLIFSGVLDRFPELTLVLSHGGGAYPYLAGRFDIMHARMDKAAQADVAQKQPSAYAPMMVYDTIVHAPKPLKFLADLVGIDRLVLGTDYSFPPADLSPFESLRAAGFSAADIETIAETNPRCIFPRLRPK